MVDLLDEIIDETLQCIDMSVFVRRPRSVFRDLVDIQPDSRLRTGCIRCTAKSITAPVFANGQHKQQHVIRSNRCRYAHGILPIRRDIRDPADRCQLLRQHKVSDRSGQLCIRGYGYWLCALQRCERVRRLMAANQHHNENGKRDHSDHCDHDRQRFYTTTRCFFDRLIFLFQTVSPLCI